MDIVGDPDWILQGELFYTSSNLSAFEKDGSCNMRASEVLFELRFNRPTDYDLPTGLTPVFKNNTGSSAITGEVNLPEEAIVFQCVKVINNFKDGKFTQQLLGTLRDFSNAVNSPEKKKQESNQVEKQPGLDAFGGAGEDVTVRSSKKTTLPVGSRGSGEFLDPRGRTPVTQGTQGVNRPPDYISGGTRPSGLKPDANKGASVTPNTNYDDAMMRNKRINSLNNASTNYVDPIVNKANWQPKVPPKPASNVVSDDAGSNKGFQGSLLKRKTQRALERSKRRVAAGAEVKGSAGGGVRTNSAFR